MFLRLLKTAVVKFLGLVLFVAGIWVGLVAFYGEEPWQKTALVQYGGMVLAWVLAGAGVTLMSFKASGVKEPANPTPP